jgi:hypothetical protein
MGAIVVFSALVSPRTGTVSATDGCNTALSQPASAGDTSITVDDVTESCGAEMWIVIHQGWMNQDCVQVLDPHGTTLDLHSALQYDHSAGESVVGVSECPPMPTPTPTPTWAPPSPTPGSQCGTYGDLQPWPGGAINPVPAFGAAGSSFDVELAGVEPNPDADQPAEVLWDWNPEGSAGELIGSGIVPRNETVTLLEGTVPVSAEPGAHTVTACWWHGPSETWYYKDATFDVPEVTPTPGFTPTPAPGAGPMLHCPQAGKWAIAVWYGPDETDTAEAFATCGEGAVDAAYALDPDTQAWRRYFPERPDISNLLTLKETQGVIARGKATPKPTPTPGYTPTPTPTPTPSAANQMHNCPQAGKWAIAVWEGANEIDTGDALTTCAEEVEAVYALDPDSQAWQRYFPERVDISNLPMLINGQAMIARGKLKLVSQGRIAFDSDLYAAGLPGVTPSPTSGGVNDGCPPVGLAECDPDGDTVCESEAAALCANDVNDDPLDDDVINDGCPAIWAPETGAQCANAIDDDGDTFLTPTPTPTFQDIYVMNPDGSAITRLTSNPGWEDIEPTWSPDSSMIAFASMRDGNYEIYVMNADGSRQTRLTNNPASDMNPAWSPDGSKIAFKSLRDGNWEIYVMNPDGSGQTNLSNRRSSDERDPDWSPDGSKIAFSSDRDVFWEIYVMNADGSGQTRLTNETETDERPDWSPDGSKIAFTSDRDGHWQIYVMNADGSGQTNLSNNAEWDRDPVWSPDGSKIAFTSSRYGNSEIYVMNAGGSRQTNLTNNPAADEDPDWR